MIILSPASQMLFSPLFFFLREEDSWWRFHYINWWLKWGWISQARLWRHHSIIPEQNDWEVPFLAEAGSDSQDKSTGMLTPRTELNCITVRLGFGTEDLSGYLDLLKTLYFLSFISFGLFFLLGLTLISPNSLCSLEWISCSIIYLCQSMFTIKWFRWERQLTCQQAAHSANILGG